MSKESDFIRTRTISAAQGTHVGILSEQRSNAGRWVPCEHKGTSLRLRKKSDNRKYVCVCRFGEGRDMLKYSINGCMILTHP